MRNKSYEKRSVVPMKPARLLFAVGLMAGLVPGSSVSASLISTTETGILQQEEKRIVTGKVVDEKNEPLIGVSVSVPGKSGLGIVTDLDGNYRLSVPADVKELRFSYIGYTPQTFSIVGKNTLNVTLKDNNQQLNELVVVGYGTQKKATLTGSIETVDTRLLENRAVTNVGLALQGATPGLVVTRSSPRPGNEGIAFAIRGATSVNGGSPLIIIDGVPSLNASSFQNLNSDDIENISVLKDGSASIYGAKAANGVILVTTKKGKGKPQVDYNFNMRFSTNGITGFSPSMQQYATMWLEANKEETIPNWWGWGSKENLEKMAAGYEGIYSTSSWGDIFLGNANRLDELFATRFSYQHNLSVAGSTDKSDYRISAEYADNQGNLATAYDGQKQINLRLNYGVRLTSWFKLETAASMIRTKTSSPSVGIDATIYGQEPPTFPAKNPYGQWYADYGTVGDRNPVAATSDGGRDDKTALQARVDLKATIDIWKGISFEGMASMQNQDYRRERYVIPVKTYDWFGNNSTLKYPTLVGTQQSLIYPDNPGNIKDINNPGYLVDSNNSFYQYYSALLKYSHTFAKVHNVSAMIGINAEKYDYKNVTLARQYFEDNGVYDISLATGEQGQSGRKGHNGTYSYIAKLNYNYAEKYLLELMGRRDGNSKFAAGHRFKNFGAFSLGWVFTQEKFFEPVTSILNFGKIRLSYGTSGNDVGLGDYDYVSTITKGTTILGNGGNVGSVIASGLSNSGLISLTRTWEKVEQKNIGVDLSFLRSRLTASFDYFIKDNRGMLTNVTYPSLLGGTAPKTNSGHLNVKGWEVQLGWRDQFKDFSYYVNFNISNTKTMLKEMEGADSYGAGKNTVNGYPLNAWFVYRTAGYFKDQPEVDRYYELYANGGADLSAIKKNSDTALRPGDVKRVDLNGDYKITATGSKDSDLQYVGDGDPHFTFGLNAGGSWKGIDFNVFFQGVGKQLIMRSGWMAYPFYAQYTNQNPNFLGQTWTEENPNAKYPRLTSKVERAKWNYANNDFMLQNSRYIRLKSVVLGYTLPQQWTRKVMLQKVRVYFSGNDLWEATSIKDGFDPEMGETSNNNGYPFFRTWSFGLNVSF